MQYSLTEDFTRDSPKLGPRVYGVLFELGRDLTITTGRLGEIAYPRGWYVYVGSEMGGISGRVKHHLGPHKKTFWHIDYILPKGRPIAVVIGETEQRLECQIASHLRLGLTGVRRFGSSDCRCAGHLFTSDVYEPLLNRLVESFEVVRCRPRVMEVVGSQE